MASTCDSQQADPRPSARPQTPIVVVRDAAKLVVVDGHKRVRALGRLGRDVAEALEWALPA